MREPQLFRLNSGWDREKPQVSKIARPGAPGVEQRLIVGTQERDGLIGGGRGRLDGQSEKQR
jgi:hypothetical protein